MASGNVQVADIVVPAIFGPYVQQMTQVKSRLIRSGAIASDERLNQVLAGGGLTFNEPSFKDLEDDAELVSDDSATVATPNKLGTATEIQVRLSRNNSWGSMDLAADLAGADPMQAIANRVSDYWARRYQGAFVATLTGVFADNAAAPSGTEHVINDMTFDVSGGAFIDGVTNFSAEAFIDATATMGDSMEDLAMVMVHSVVYARMMKNNLIDFVQDSINGEAVRIPTFLGREVIVDDSMPVTSGVINSWLFGRGAVRAGTALPRVPAEVERKPGAGNGAGQEILHSRVQWCLHPVGCAYVGTAANGGPSNANSANNLANAASFKRVFPERKQIKIARLITREY
jgi:hypothetical protein